MSNSGYSTASIAGRTESKEWTACSVLEARLGMLVQHQEKLVRLGLLTNLDEVAAARRSWQRLMGPTGVNFFKIEQDRYGKKCWKHLLSGRDQALLSLRALKEGLVKAKERRFLAQSEAKLCMTERKYQSKKEVIKRK